MLLAGRNAIDEFNLIAVGLCFMANLQFHRYESRSLSTT